MKVKKKKKNWTMPILLLSTVASMMLQWGGDNDEEVAAKDDRGDDAFGDAIRDAQKECESDKEKAKFERMLEDHRKSLYPIAEEGQKKLGTTLELLQWKAKNGTSDKAFGQLLKIIKKMLPVLRGGGL